MPLLLGYASALRRSELVALAVADVEWQLAAIADGAIFRPVRENKALPRRLTDEVVYALVKRLGAAAGLDPAAERWHEVAPMPASRCRSASPFASCSTSRRRGC